jgi:hypothetical protein
MYKAEKIFSKVSNPGKNKNSAAARLFNKINKEKIYAPR